MVLRLKGELSPLMRPDRGSSDQGSVTTEGAVVAVVAAAGEDVTVGSNGS